MGMGLWRKIVCAGALITVQTATAEVTVNVADFGAVPDDGKDDTSAVAAAVKHCAGLKNAVRLLFSRGRYDFPGETVNAIRIDNLNDLTVDGNGATLNVRNTTPLLFSGCHRLTVRNLTIDSADRHYTPGKIIGTTTHSIDIEVAPAYPVHAAMPILNLQDFDPATGIVIGNLDIFDRGIASVVQLRPQVLRITMKKLADQRKMAYLADVLAKLKPGTMAVMRHRIYGRYGLDFVKCRDVKIEDVTIHTVPGMGIHAGECTNTALRRVKIVPRDGEMMSTTADAMMFLYQQGELSLEDCEVLRAADDCFSVMNKYLEIDEIPDHRTIAASVKVGWSGPLPQPGDQIEFYRGRNLEQSGTATVKSAIWEAENKQFRIVFDGNLPAGTQTGDAMIMTRYVPKVKVKNCVFGEGRARGMIIASRDVQIENCTIRRTGMPGIKIWTEKQISIHMGPPSAKIVIRNTLFDECGMVPLFVYAGTANPAPTHRNIVIENNTFRADGPLNRLRTRQQFPRILYYSCAVYCSSMADSIIRNNTFTGYAVPVFIADSRNVEITNNRSDITAAILCDPRNNHDITIKSNVNMAVTNEAAPYRQGINFYSDFR